MSANGFCVLNMCIMAKFALNSLDRDSFAVLKLSLRHSHRKVALMIEPVDSTSQLALSILFHRQPPLMIFHEILLSRLRRLVSNFLSHEPVKPRHFPIISESSYERV